MATSEREFLWSVMGRFSQCSANTAGHGHHQKDLSPRFSFLQILLHYINHSLRGTPEVTAAQVKACDSGGMLEYFMRWSAIADNRFLFKVREQNIQVGEHQGQV